MNFRAYFLILIFNLFLLASCSPAIDEKRDESNPSRVNWGMVPKEYNPQVAEYQYNIVNVNSIDIDLMGFNRDVEVKYSQKVPFGSVQMKLYRVWHKQPSWGTVVPSTSNNNLVVRTQGNYSCEIKVVASEIKELEGGCYVRLEVLLPLWAQVSVINAGRSVTPTH